MESNGTTNHPADCDVSVQLSDCGRQDATAVFEALDRVFAGRDMPSPGPEQAHDREPTVWMATFDSSTRRENEPAPSQLGAEVTALLTGDQQAVAAVEKAIGELFEVRSATSVSGEHEREARLLLAPRQVTR
ncbi:hypothetical protein [Streptomyces lavendofoliae]|uniref:Uncharacterized protein n=1 Tax=Streptomyces lavendofoliae TaxID=67314 RepID=A0A918I114_9ACTN|nr:hypothetical protein [Streptomyces lavendofoliae]GGU48340.1 hypothetical protein GCM10010274_41290 [Streptomyces lavendofoliae]